MLPYTPERKDVSTSSRIIQSPTCSQERKGIRRNMSAERRITTPNIRRTWIFW